MSAEKPHIIITDSNGQEQSDSYQNNIFENVSEQQEKLFCRVTSSDNQPKNQQPNVEAIPQQEMQYQECNENMQDPYSSPVSPSVMPQQGLYDTPQTVSAPQNIVQPAMSNSNTLQAARRTETNISSYLLSSRDGRLQCVFNVHCSGKCQCRQPFFCK